jgi:hypothetical protein
MIVALLVKRQRGSRTGVQLPFPEPDEGRYVVASLGSPPDQKRESLPERFGRNDADIEDKGVRFEENRG